MPKEGVMAAAGSVQIQRGGKRLSSSERQRLEDLNDEIYQPTPNERVLPY
jgi:hypothetical protein